jgi:LacI family transcriptional regulator
VKKLKVNIKTIADKTGVSTATVSRVLNGYKGIRESTREKVLKVINEYDYEINAIAKSLKQKRTMTIGIVLGNVLSQFYSIIAKAVEDTASKYGFSTVLCNGDDDPVKELKYLKVLKSNRVDGIILTPTGKNAGYVNNLILTGTKIVLLDRLIEGVSCDAVLVDNLNGSFKAIKHLIDRGYKRIGIVNGYIDRTTGHDRLEGYKRALKEAGIKIDSDLIKIGDFKKKSGYELTEELLESKPDAIFVTNIDMVLGSVLLIKEKGLKIPSDIAFVGFDDSEWVLLLDPPLTVVRQPVYNLGETASEILIKKITNNEDANNPLIHILNTELIIRMSTLKSN